MKLRMSIYMIQRVVEADNPHDNDYVIEPDYGYFTQKEDAEAYIEQVLRGPRAEALRRMDEYATEYKAWVDKDHELRKLGGRNAAYLRPRPSKGYEELSVLEVEPA